MGRKRLIDLSIGIEPGLPSDPPMMIPKIDYINHEMGAEQMMEFFPGVTKDQLPAGLGWAMEFLALTTHSGTHLDAPFHYHPTMNKGERAWTIDEIPLEWCFSDGVVLDFRHKEDGERITVAEVEAELERIRYELKLSGNSLLSFFTRPASLPDACMIYWAARAAWLCSRISLPNRRAYTWVNSAPQKQIRAE
jgi:kynurenine formamidase